MTLKGMWPVAKTCCVTSSNMPYASKGSNIIHINRPKNGKHKKDLEVEEEVTEEEGEEGVTYISEELEDEANDRDIPFEVRWVFDERLRSEIDKMGYNACNGVRDPRIAVRISYSQLRRY